MAQTGLTIIRNDIEKRLDGMLTRSRLMQGYLNRVVYPQYQAAQNKRFMTENASETGQWAALNPAYAARKLKKFAAFPGGGTKMLIATQRLQKGVVGDSDTSEHRKVVDNSSIVVTTSVPYAVYVNEKRDISGWGASTTSLMLSGMARYIRTGEMS